MGCISFLGQAYGLGHEDSHGVGHQGGMNMTDSFRLTFNKPAVAQLLLTDTGETADGLKVRIEDGKAQFLPVRGSNDGDVLSLTDRSRGGVEATIEGSMADDIAEALRNNDGPFHTLNRVGQGWLEAQPHGRAEAPSKFVPHVRVWDADVVARPKKSKTKAAKKTTSRRNGSSRTQPTAERGPMSVPDMIEQLRTAKRRLDVFDSEKRRGQPPREIREAREAIAAFQQAAIDFLPEIVEAHAILHRVVEGSGDEALARKVRANGADTPVKARRQRKATKRTTKARSRKPESHAEVAATA